jgi:hypothetical protein
MTKHGSTPPLGKQFVFETVYIRSKYVILVDHPHIFKIYILESFGFPNV